MAEYLTRNGLCRIAGRTRGEIEHLFELGLPHEITGSGRGTTVKVDLNKALSWFVGQVLEPQAKPESDGRGLDLNKERARLAKEQADHAALKNAVLRSELLSAADVSAGWQDATARARSLLLGLPASCIDELSVLMRTEGPLAVRDFLADRIHDALTELARTDDLEDDADEEPQEGSTLAPSDMDPAA